ncbi:hypothetical protein quinque_014985 [Culex quinquefasciatus]
MFRPQLNPSENIREKMRLFEGQDANLECSGGQRRRHSDVQQYQQQQQHFNLTSGSASYDQFQTTITNDRGSTRMMPPINRNDAQQGHSDGGQGLIVPKKLINPCVDSMDRQNLHRELMFNQKMGKSVLNQKSELQRALEKQKERQVLAAQNLAKQQAAENSIANELGRVIMQRAARLEQKNLAAAAAGSGSQSDPHPDSINPEYLNARAKLRATQAAAVYSK